MKAEPYAISPRDSASGLPSSSVMIVARSSWFAMHSSNQRRRIAERSLAVSARHSGKAFSAAPIALRVSAVPSVGTVPSLRPTAGLLIASTAPLSASIQLPSR